MTDKNKPPFNVKLRRWVRILLRVNTCSTPSQRPPKAPSTSFQTTPRNYSTMKATSQAPKFFPLNVRNSPTTDWCQINHRQEPPITTVGRRMEIHKKNVSKNHGTIAKRTWSRVDTRIRTQPRVHSTLDVTGLVCQSLHASPSTPTHSSFPISLLWER